MSLEERIRRLPWVTEFQMGFVKRDPVHAAVGGPVQADGLVHSYVWYAKTRTTEYGETAPVPALPADPELLRKALLVRAFDALRAADPDAKTGLHLVKTTE